MKCKYYSRLRVVVFTVMALLLIVTAVCTTSCSEDRSSKGEKSNDRKTEQDNDVSDDQFSLKIYTDSMYPTFKAGDTIICERISDPGELRTGDIITFWVVINGERVLNTHRINNIYDGGDCLIFETKGDANEQVDPLTVHEYELVGKYVRKSSISEFSDAVKDLFS